MFKKEYFGLEHNLEDIAGQAIRSFEDMMQSERSAVKIPKNLKDAIEENRCILFLGAGASMDAVDGHDQSLPHWGQLISELIELMQESAEPQTNEVMVEIDILMDRGDYLTVADWLEKKLGPADFRGHLMKRLSTAKNSRVHEILSKKKFRAVMTTNYDSLAYKHWSIENKNPFTVIPQNPESISIANDALDIIQNITPIIYAHGALNDIKSLIFFPRSYREIMFNNDPFRNFMAKIFQQFTFLFIGTSFRDPNMQSLLQWVYTMSNGQNCSHYAILDNKGPVFRSYMKNNYNIDFITYSSINGNHSNLVDILEKL